MFAEHLRNKSAQSLFPLGCCCAVITVTHTMGMITPQPHGKPLKWRALLLVVPLRVFTSVFLFNFLMEPGTFHWRALTSDFLFNFLMELGWRASVGRLVLTRNQAGNIQVIKVRNFRNTSYVGYLLENLRRIYIFPKRK